MATVLNLTRRAYLKTGQQMNRRSLDYLSAKYINIKQILTPEQSYVVTQSDEANAPGLAFRFYGDRGYWWVLCLYNGILDPITGFEPGTVIQIPNLADINALLSSQDEQQLLASTVTI